MVLTAILLEGNGHYRVIHIQGSRLSPDEGDEKKNWGVVFNCDPFISCFLISSK